MPPNIVLFDRSRNHPYFSSLAPFSIFFRFALVLVTNTSILAEHTRKSAWINNLLVRVVSRVHFFRCHGRVLGRQPMIFPKLAVFTRCALANDHSYCCFQTT
ncbi:hypothetical protein, unlikely [Trypanosoma brucei gambiense DAL972]|uniref:Uncharacterized protein n=1 Tax=Trypanosoma brucei gambiense (strain MHOM/CI/86/DAL972) TaxID=679716 RepID=C9ZWS8_TRYB9|nr:hypothetical protein, unlikely [Trypanosoma brucei gambiense DAL972]CBH13867.1 hypothetical protein, unlikely [Trypanosoma brucei gambiense DAL972]|eukprot:XP_011776143.1 hypothetical protein, unlikely [Trypanosoma brucei gambiense DAL972]